MVPNDLKAFVLFVLAQCLAFSCIALLQMTSTRMFIPLLLVMHVGIVLFIVSKKRLVKTRPELHVHYRISYVCLALFLPILFYRLVAETLLQTMHEGFVFILTMIAVAISVVTGILNTLRMSRSLRS